MSTQEITDAAKAHAKEILGEEQYKKNSYAAQSIINDFKAGVAFAQKQLQKN